MSDTTPLASPAQGARTTVWRRFGRLTPVTIAALAAPLILQRQPVTGLPIVLQLLSFAALTSVALVRSRLPMAASAALVVGAIYVFGVSALSAGTLVQAAGLGIAIVLLVANVALRKRTDLTWMRAIAIAATGTALAIACFFSKQLVHDPMPFTVQWLAMGTLYFAFVLFALVEINRMLQHLSQSAIPTIANGLQLDAPPESSWTRRLTRLEEENQRLHAINRNLEDFVYVVAHDLRAPLRTISGFVQLLSEDLRQPLTTAAARDLAGIATGIGRMQSLVARWLQLARHEHAALHIERVDLSEIASELGRELQVAEPQSDVTLSIEPNLSAEADPVLIRELLQNLLGNAWKYCARYSKGARIEFGASADAEQTIFYVRDNGMGFDPADAEALFEPFKQLHTQAPRDGAGVGLAISRRIVERHQGRIWAEGRPGCGATFSFSLRTGAHTRHHAQSHRIAHTANQHSSL